MRINNQNIQTHFDRKNITKKDISAIASVIENDIRLISAEILRLSRLPYASWGNMERIRSLDEQIRYLEEVLANYEKALKGKI